VRIRLALAAAALACAATPAHALLVCGSGALFASAVVVSATDLVFSYTPSSNAFASADVRVRCGALGIDLLPSFTVSLTSANGGSPATRYLTGPGANLGYNVYINNSYSGSAVWGDGSAGSVTQSYGSILVLGDIKYTAWGRVPAGQYVAAGTYADVMTVTVSY
jgi:spore coat protein U-like protein